MAVPAEEFIDFDIRRKLKAEGKIEHLSGKLELLHRGYFDHAEYVIATHAAGGEYTRFINSVLNMSGFKIMNFRFKGRSAHAGAAPHLGLNAQNSAALFLQACAFLRESFREDDHIRIHPVLRLPEDQSVNLIPAAASVQTYVRAASMKEVNTTVDKLRAAAEGCGFFPGMFGGGDYRTWILSFQGGFTASQTGKGNSGKDRCCFYRGGFLRGQF